MIRLNLNFFKKKAEIKNFAFILISLSFSFLLVAISALRLSQSQVKAQTGQDETSLATNSGSAAPTQSQTVDYYLPYPGILPDHPLYWLKMTRDRIMLWLTFNPNTKFERLLLFADKRIGAAKVLTDGGKVQLGITTATKAEKYLEQAYLTLIQIKNTGQVDPALVTNLTKAVLKHQELIMAMLNKVEGQSKEAVNNTLINNNSIYENIIKI